MSHLMSVRTVTVTLWSVRLFLDSFLITVRKLRLFAIFGAYRSSIYLVKFSKRQTVNLAKENDKKRSKYCDRVSITIVMCTLKIKWLNPNFFLMLKKKKKIKKQFNKNNQ